MEFAELFILAIGLSMDALAVAICKGLSIQCLKPRHALTVGEIGRASCRERVCLYV